jgi:molecular chaperone DnaK
VRFTGDALTVSDPVVIEPEDVEVIQPEKLDAVVNAEEGIEHYVDRGNVITVLPELLAGGVLIPGANDDKELSEPDNYLVFDVERDSTVFVAFDGRGAPERSDWWPAWIAEQGFEPTEMIVETDDGAQGGMAVFAKDVPAGRVTLGPNAASTGSSSSYITFVLSYGR